MKEEKRAEEVRIAGSEIERNRRMSYTLEFEFCVRYNIQRPVRVADVIDSLNGLSQLLPTTLPILRGYDTYHAPKGIDCRVKSVEEGSLLDTLLTVFFFDSEEDARQWVRSIKRKTGIEVMDKKLPLLAPIIKGVVVVGGAWLIGHYMASGETIEDDHSNLITLQENATAIIQTGSGVLNISERQFRKQIEKAAKKVSIAKAACTFVKPARDNSEAVAISFDDEPIDTIDTSCLNADVISAMPEIRQVGISEVMTQELERTELRIRACDIDYADKGWFAVVPAVSDKRLKLIMGEGVDRSRLALGVYQAHVTLKYTITEEGDRKYKSVTLNAILAE